MNQLSLIEFGKRLLDSRDLDPVYVLLHEAKLPSPVLKRWLLTYFCFYHCGTSSWVTDRLDYWKGMRTAAGSKDYPRCHERRHFRGEAALRSVDWLEAKGVGQLFQPLLGDSLKLKTVMEYIQTWVGFGPWIAFKVADMLDRLGIVKVEFDSGAMFLFDSPEEGAALAWDKYGNGQSDLTKNFWAVDYILSHLGKEKAPPRYERTINCQEAETILCKWKSHMNGRYHVGEDIKATRSGLLKFTRCNLSQRLLAAGEQAGLWK